MKKFNIVHVVIAIIISWIIIFLPYFVPTLNTPARFLGIPATVWLALVAFLICLIVNALAVRYTWETFDEEDAPEEEAK